MSMYPASTHRRFASGRLARAAARRGAFTLIEMLVALAVMVLAMAMVTTVFSVTAKTTAMSAAVSEAETLARNFALQLEEDLRGCDPARSVLVLVGRTQAAALTEDQRRAGLHYRELIGDPGNINPSLDPKFAVTPPPEYSDPRADILMFFTQRPSGSQSPPVAPVDNFGRALQRGAQLSPVQVVYGHAALDTAVRSGGSWAFADNLTHIETSDPTNLSPLPVTRWHLARRATIINDTSDLYQGSYAITALFFRGNDRGTSPDNRTTAYPRILRCLATNSFAGDTLDYPLELALKMVSPQSPHIPARCSPYTFWGTFPSSLPTWNPLERRILLSLLYPAAPAADPLYHHVATVIEQPPEALRDNLALDLVPGCAWFQVEFLLPEDPRNSRTSPLSDQRRDTARWVRVTPGSTYVFVPDTDENREYVQSQVGLAGLADQPNPNSRLSTFAQVVPPNAPYNGQNSVYNRIVRMWPYAIRVTIRVIDHNGRLDAPIERSIVHWFP